MEFSIYYLQKLIPRPDYRTWYFKSPMTHASFCLSGSDMRLRRQLPMYRPSGRVVSLPGHGSLPQSTGTVPTLDRGVAMTLPVACGHCTETCIPLALVMAGVDSPVC